MLILLIGGCAERPAPPAPAPAPISPPTAAVRTFEPRKLPDAPGLHNLLEASPRIYSGSEPHGEQAFASLAKLGVKTVVSVDGARPDVAAAARYGLRYVHVPIGYDGVPRKAGESLTRLVHDVDGPIYIHCHHGQHRGPAAAAVACIAVGYATPEQARALLEAAGTGKNYPGLWRDVAGFVPPAKGANLPELLETAEVESFAAAMAKIDRNFDNLKLCQQTQWTVPADHPDVVPRHEALILREILRESLRNLVADRPAEFREWLQQSAALSESLEESLQRDDPLRATRLLEQLERSCKQCHARYRNG